MSGYTRELPDGTVIYSASSIGYCPRALYYDRLGVTHEPPPEFMQKAWDQGNDNEPRIMEHLTSQKVWDVLTVDDCAELGFGFGEFDKTRNVDYSSQVRAEKRAGGVVVRAHLDGIATCIPEQLTFGDRTLFRGDRVIVEAKAFGDSFWQQFKSKGLAAFPKYQWQVSVQMHATGLPCLFVVGKKNKHGIVDFVETEMVLTPPISWGKIVAKISSIERMVDSKTPPSCSDPVDYPCPFYPFHDNKLDMFGKDITGADAEIEVVEGQRARTLATLADRYEMHKKKEAEHKREAEAAKSALLGYFDKKLTENALPVGSPVKAEGWVITAKPGGRKGSVDTDKLAKDGVDIEKYRKPGSSWVTVEVERG